MQPCLVITIDHESVGAPTHAIRWRAKFNGLHLLGQTLNIMDSKSPHAWFINFHVAKLLIKPTHNVLVCQVISLHQLGCFISSGTPGALTRTNKCNLGCMWRGFSFFTPSSLVATLSLRLVEGPKHGLKEVQLLIH